MSITLIYLFFLLWILFLLYAYRSLVMLPSLDQAFESIPQIDNFSPKISIIIAVKDGEKEIEATVLRLVKSHYPNLEIIVVNDRSKDRTKEIVTLLEQKYNSIKCIHINTLPSGWLGKVHALHQGVQSATGDYVLFMDADVEISAKVLEMAVATCHAKNLDHLGVLPNIHNGSFLLNLMMSTSIILFTISARPWQSIEKRPVKNVKGVGAFNMVRRSAFLKTEGFEWLKMDVTDDVALAQLMAKNNGRSLLLKAAEEGPSLAWYSSFKHLVLGLEKNVVGGLTNYQLHLVAILLIFFSLPLVLSVFVLFMLQVKVVLNLVVLAIISQIIFTMASRKYLKKSKLEIFAFPLGLFIFACILLRSAIICYKNGGIKWSGTFYPMQDLKKGVRIKINF